jgi:hypothetical protein
MTRDVAPIRRVLFLVALLPAMAAAGYGLWAVAFPAPTHAPEGDALCPPPPGGILIGSLIAAAGLVGIAAGFTWLGPLTIRRRAWLIMGGIFVALVGLTFPTGVSPPGAC